MKLAILGGSGFRLPVGYEALLNGGRGPLGVGEVWLYSADGDRLDAMSLVLDGLAEECAADSLPPAVHATTDLEAAVRGADFVLYALRNPGDARALYERITIDHDLVGQETVGAAGLAAAMTTIPRALEVARVIDELAPRATVFAFTEPVGLITQAMQKVLGDRVVGICESPTGLVNGVCAALGLTEDERDRVRPDYVGISHLGWLRGLHLDHRDLLAELLADRDKIESFDEGKLFGADWIQQTGIVPNEFVYYYDFTREAKEAARRRQESRSEFLERRQSLVFEEVLAATDGVGDADAPAVALATWRRVCEEAAGAYEEEARAGIERIPDNVSAAGYEGIAVSAISAITSGERTYQILNIRNGRALPKLPPDAVIEVLARVEPDGIMPAPIEPLPLSGRLTGVCIQVKCAQALAIEAVMKRSPDLAVQALAAHPLVDSVTTAQKLIAAYRSAIPRFDAVFTQHASEPDDSSIADGLDGPADEGVDVALHAL